MVSKLTFRVPLLLLLLAFMAQGGVGEDSVFYFGPTTDVFWGLTDVNRTRTCILLTGILEIIIPYETDFFTRATAKIPIPRNAAVSGSCGNESFSSPSSQSMTLTWSPDPAIPSKGHSVTFTFLRKGTQETLDKDVYYELETIEANISVNELQFPDAFDFDQKYILKASNLGTLISAQDQSSYYCKSLQVIQFDDGVNTIAMSFVHAQAFHTRIALGDGTDFGPKYFCSKDGLEVMLMVLTYMVVLALIGLAIFYIWDRKKRSSYEYL